MSKDTLKDKISFYFNDSSTRQGQIVDCIFALFNILACVLYVISTYTKAPSTLFIVIETIVSLEFLIEYLLRIWIAPKRINYIFSFYGIIDFVTLLPFFITGFKFLRVLKVLRILRFIRLLEQKNIFFWEFSQLHLQALRTIFSIFTILFLAAGFILDAEHVKGVINSFGIAFYFCVTTLSTVGFGDFSPMTSYGRTVTVLMIMLGAILVPWQAGLLIRELIMSSRQKKDVICKQCGLKEHDLDASHCKACGAVIFQEYTGD
jgi:voltage-gated potassium channel